MSIARQAPWLVAAAILIAGCSPTEAPAPGAAGPAAPATADSGPQQPEPQRPEPQGTDPDFAARFEPMQVPANLRDFQTALEALGRLSLQNDQLLSYFQRVDRNPESTSQEDVTKVVEHLVDVTRTGMRLKSLVTNSNYGFNAWYAAASILRQEPDTPTGALITRAFEAVATRLATSADECVAFDFFQLNMLTNTGASWVPEEFISDFVIARYETGKSACGVVSNANFTDAQATRLARLLGDEAHAAPTAELALQFRKSCRSHEPDSTAEALGICPWASGLVGGSAEIVGQPPPPGEEPLLKLNQKGAFHHYASDEKYPDFENLIIPLEPYLKRVAAEGQGSLLQRVLARIVDGETGRVRLEHWLNPAKTTLAFSVSISDTVLVALITSDDFKILRVPESFGRDDHVVGISDADADGNVEVWVLAAVGDCEGAEEDTELPTDCHVESYHRFEQFGDRLIPYIEGRRPAHADAPKK